MEGRIRALKQWFAFTCFSGLSTCLIQRWSHIWRATWWLWKLFCRVSSTRLFISDSTILRFRHFIDQYGLAQKFLERTVNLAVEAGACSFEMVAADGTFIEAPSSTKNKAHARDPEMASGKKANTWHFGMKEHIAACSEAGDHLRTVAAPANQTTLLISRP